MSGDEIGGEEEEEGGFQTSTRRLGESGVDACHRAANNPCT